LISPVFSVALTYKPFAQTTLTVGASRTISPSPLQGQITTTSALNANFQQRFLQKFTLSLNGTYNNTDYTASTIAPGSFDRSDNFYSFTARVDWAFWKRANASVFYTYSRDNSTLAGFSFDSSQIGAEIGYRF
jgi:hypothetical protein